MPPTELLESPPLFGFSEETFEEPLAMYDVINTGVPIANLDNLATFLSPEDTTWKYRIMSSASYHRYKKGKMLLTSDVTQKVARIAAVVHAAYEIFQDTRKARDFLNRPHPLLRGKPPIELAISNEAGARAVTDILFGGAYGGGA